MQKLLSSYYRRFLNSISTRISHQGRMDCTAQRTLYLEYLKGFSNSCPLMGLDSSGFRNYSQDDLDGRLLYIFAAIGFESKIGIELACGYPEGSNLANLILNWDWDALLLDANDDAIYQTQKFYNEHSSCNVFPPKNKAYLDYKRKYQ